ncbi:tripartite tricarboxylate transporter substrate binding protein [Pigmentiphaga soli]|uniref:tripartite tricarboxylate transporter substrate binding protein n=1 Tax=Pigmentiphaga soli TaxID=1007095 RepID=UPI0031EBE30D
MRKHSSWTLPFAAAIGWLAMAACGGARAGPYPDRPARIIVPATAGGNNDLVARALAAGMAGGLGQPVVVENRPGASSLVGTQYVGKAAPDGYTILHASNTFAVAPSLLKDAGYDPIEDFAAVSLTSVSPQVLLVNPKLPVGSVPELIAFAKASKKPLSYGSAGVGGTAHIAAEMFARQAGVKLLHVPYKGNSQAMADLIGGQIDMLFDLGSTAFPQVKSGLVRALAVTGRRRLPLMAGLPTMEEAGLPDYEDVVFTGLFVPARTPPETLRRLQREVRKAVQDPAIKSQFQQVGIELVASDSPEQFARYVAEEFRKKAALIKAAHIDAQ